MSSSERAMREQAREDRTFKLAVENGMRQALATAEGRALLWWLYAVEAQTEAMADHQRRAVGMALALQAKKADFGGWLLMREEHERPRLVRQSESEGEAEPEEGAE